MSREGSTYPVNAGDRAKVVFFVDDEEELRRVTRRLLEDRGYEVLTAASSAEASELIESHTGPIDVLLMDINLPDGWGASVAYRLLQVRPEMALVYTTGAAAQDPVLSGGIQAAEFMLMKPYSADELVAELERAMAAGS